MTLSVSSPLLLAAAGYSKSEAGPYRRECIVTVDVTNHGLTPVFGVQAFLTGLDGEVNPDTSPLKWTGHEAYERCILPGQTVKLDVCGIGVDGIYLHTAGDILPERAVFVTGSHVLSGTVVAEGDAGITPFSVTVNLPTVT